MGGGAGWGGGGGYGDWQDAPTTLSYIVENVKKLSYD